MIKQKRKSLETFIREQLIGPGGCKDRYSVLHDRSNENSNIARLNESKVSLEDSFGEVINTTPGSIYSSAILFPPNQLSASSNSPALNSTNTDDDPNFDNAEDIDALGRRFPSKFGISCCLEKENANENLRITISGRYYKKIKTTSALRIHVEDDITGFKKFLQDDVFVTNVGTFVQLDGNNLKIVGSIPSDGLANKRDGLRIVDKHFCKQIATANGNETLRSIYESTKEEYRFLSSYKEKLYEALTKVDVDANEYKCENNVAAIKNEIADVEKYETYISYIKDALSFFDSHDFGYWEAINFTREIDLSQIDLTSQRVFKADDFSSLKNLVQVDLAPSVTLSLDVWLQSIVKNEKLYLKVLVVNSSTPITTGVDVRYFSIVTEKVNERCFFGVKIDIASSHLLEYHDESVFNESDAEIENLKFLYRKIKDYGVGHLCSVDWSVIGNSGHVWSEFLPSIETPDVETIPRNKSVCIEADGKLYAKPYLESNPQCLQFKWLSVFSDAKDEEIRDGLKTFVESYRQWIDDLNHEEDSSAKIAQENLQKCRDDYNRMYRNIQDFLSVPANMQAFRLMNAAMFMQLWHSKEENKEIIRNSRKNTTFNFYKNNADDTAIFKGVHAAWRPFQLAFILLNLDGVFRRNPDKEWTERNELVDLVWFPTGGGKTEAYLGIIALVALNRRIEYGENGGGTAAIMRYTLRLLTTQQFQRALRMIMALEQIRKWNPELLGHSEFSIGLYVGSGALPNTNDDLMREVQHWERTHGKVPLDKCPWCGDKIAHVYLDRKQLFRCQSPRCSFGGRSTYPARLCDEQIYLDPPTLLLGTVDKLAQLAKKISTTQPEKDSRRLFTGAGYLSPDLIIQDELHLLLGPIGSAVALFECAIDQLCTRTDENGFKIRPKIIASTATTRNTSLQIRALYDRSVSIFPKSGVDYDDSFFAFYKRYKNNQNEPWTYMSKRKYIGVLPTGRTQMTTQIRLAAILFVHRALFELENLDHLKEKDYQKAADYYYTVISYFNSLKEVGKTDAQFYQEFTKYTQRLFKRVLRYSNMLECFYAYNEHFRKAELTGRLSGEDAVAALSKVQSRKWDIDKRLPFKENDQWYGAQLPVDLILATNMISVGLDVSRFNTIIMNSMPRNIAEYIQASSRVARDAEGLVLTLHNPFNQRDVSHFEMFREFHEKMYRYVEPISITPFSPKAIERFLPIFLATYIRHKFTDLTNNEDAKGLTSEKAKQIKTEICAYFEERTRRSLNLSQGEAALLTPEMFETIRSYIQKNLEIWSKLVQNNPQNLVYHITSQQRRRTNSAALFVSPLEYEGDSFSNNWLIPEALRVIEPETVIHIKH